MGETLKNDGNVDAWRLRPEAEPRGRFSLSGAERDALFIQDAHGRFRDVSGLSGLDSATDSRAFVTFDFNRDGWVDIAKVSANAPFFQIFRHRGSPSAAVDEPSAFLAIRLIGGQRSAEAKHALSPRDAVGTRVVVRIGSRTLTRQLSLGEGLASQNSSTLLIGLGKISTKPDLIIYWTSGKIQTIQKVDINRLLIVHEPDGEPREGIVEERPYRPTKARGEETAEVVDPWFIPPALLHEGEPLRFFPASEDAPEGTSGAGFDDTAPDEDGKRGARARARVYAREGDKRIQLYVGTATWCDACARELPLLHRIQARFGAMLELFAIPMDPRESEQDLQRYTERWHPPYTWIRDAVPETRHRFRRMLKDVAGSDAFPSYILVDEDGRVIDIGQGVPSLSILERMATGAALAAGVHGATMSGGDDSHASRDQADEQVRQAPSNTSTFDERGSHETRLDDSD